jgi:conjugative relaxase-like TrwC/TraI family protein
VERADVSSFPLRKKGSTSDAFKKKMLRIVQQSSVEGAKSYFKASKGSGRGAYYAEGGDAIGAWGGEGAAMLGLEGNIKWKEFERLCENRHPLTGEKLTPMNRRNRRVGYDVSFHAPKSFSLMAEWTLDPDLREALFSAVLLTMKDLEKEARTRVRLNGVEDDSRVSGNLTYGIFLHRTTRPLDNGEPDMHWHIHAFVFNATFDLEEKRWKALDFSECKRMARCPFHKFAAGGSA